jgi:hypothetical protein
MKIRNLLHRVKGIRRRQGVTAMLSMLYLILFSALAVGFYGAVTTSVQIVGNEQRGSRAFLAAESGMEFMRFHLANLAIGPTTPLNERMDAIYDYLTRDPEWAIEGTLNMGTNRVGYANGILTIPENPDAFIALDGNTGFRATVATYGAQLIVTTVGRYTGGSGTQTVRAGRGIELKYDVAARASNIFDYGVASRSAVIMGGSTIIRGAGGNDAYGSILADTNQSPPLRMDGEAAISGDVSLTGFNPISVSSTSTIGGSVTYGVPSPDFPKVNSLIFEPYATRIIDSASPSGTFENIRIKAGTNPNFSANTVIRGVVYVETPNQVVFAGGANITGVIVQQHEPLYDSTVNSISFRGEVRLNGVDQLPDQPQFQGLKELTGSAILAPNFALEFRGNFGTVAGTIIGGNVRFTGEAGGTVRGSVINMEENRTMSLSGSATVTIESQGTGDYPAGVYFGENYVPIPGSYREVQP